MSYKRLTKRIDENTYNILELPYDDPILAVVTRLGNFEDLAESGELRLIRTAHWVPERKATTYNGCINWNEVYRCSCCHRVEAKKEPYCHCGAYMEGSNV